jgi:hypothetical protein
MSDLLDKAKRWRRLAREARTHAEDMGAAASRAELLVVAVTWEKKAAEAEAISRLSNGPLPPLLADNTALRSG